MKRISLQELFQLTFVVFICSLFFAGCGIGQRDEVIAGVTIPIPGGMSKAEDQRIELSVPGFGAAQVAYRGKVAPDKIVAFYQKEMPARGWKPNASLVTRGGLLAYSRDNKNVLIMVGQSGSDTTLSVIVGG